MRYWCWATSLKSFPSSARHQKGAQLHGKAYARLPTYLYFGTIVALLGAESCQNYQKGLYPPCLVTSVCLQNNWNLHIPISQNVFVDLPVIVGIFCSCRQHPKIIPNSWPNHPQTIPKSSPNHPQIISKSSPNCPRIIAKSSPNDHHHIIPKWS
jgi:hypothetical protein